MTETSCSGTSLKMARASRPRPSISCRDVRIFAAVLLRYDHHTHPYGRADTAPVNTVSYGDQYACVWYEYPYGTAEAVDVRRYAARARRLGECRARRNRDRWPRSCGRRAVGTQARCDEGQLLLAFQEPRRVARGSVGALEARYTEGIIAALSQGRDPRDRLERLITQVNLSEGATRFHAALTASADHPVVRPVLARVTARRLEYLVEGFRGIGLTPALARRRALLAYTAYIGLTHLARRRRLSYPRAEREPSTFDMCVETLLAT